VIKSREGGSWRHEGTSRSEKSRLAGEAQRPPEGKGNHLNQQKKKKKSAQIFLKEKFWLQEGKKKKLFEGKTYGNIEPRRHRAVGYSIHAGTMT